ncbi:MAG TPA: S9 family peptidase [Polyangiaceae bacterium]|jgi:oligopeptidase B
MRPALLLLLSLSALLACAELPAQVPARVAPVALSAPTASVAPPVASGPRPPVAKKVPHEWSLFGEKHVDDYAWLREKGAPDVVSYLQAEDAYTDAMTRGTAPFQKTLYDEMVSRIQEDDATPPVKDGAWLYYKRFEKGKQYPLHCRRRALVNAPEQVMLDENAIAADHPFVSVVDLTVTDDGNTLAYLLDTTGFRQYTLKTEDLRTGRAGSEAIPRVDSMAFARDGRTMLYVTEDAQTKRAGKLWRHVLGADAAKDALVYDEKDERFDLGVQRTRSKAFFVITSASRTTSEVRVLDAARPEGAWRLIAPREQDHEYYVAHRGGLFYVLTNSGGRNFRVVTAPVESPGREHWKELVPHRADVMIEEMMLFRDHMVLVEREDALPQVSIYDLRTGKSHRVEQPEPVFDVQPDMNPEFGATSVRFRYESFKTPRTWVDYDLSSQERVVVKKTEVPGGYDESAYETRRMLEPARDGTLVPVSLVYRKGTVPNGQHPLWLYGYGSYGFATPINFKGERISLLDRGVVYAIAHVRGGGDMGKKWHDQGRMANKMNTFTDFIDVAEDLKKDGWAKKDGLAISGGSAGGLLMGAVVNMRPDLFKAVVAYVPWVDVIDDMLDETLPLTVNEFEEWGNPKKKDELAWMARYSPYDNVTAQAYPPMLVRSSYNDSQVMYWGPAKWVAKLRATKTDDNPLLLEMNMDPAGHGGKSGRYDRVGDLAFDYAFVLTQLGITR